MVTVYGNMEDMVGVVSAWEDPKEEVCGEGRRVVVGLEIEISDDEVSGRSMIGGGELVYV